MHPCVLLSGPGFSQSSPDVTDNFEDMEYVDSSGEKEYLSAFVIPKVGACRVTVLEGRVNFFYNATTPSAPVAANTGANAGADASVAAAGTGAGAGIAAASTGAGAGVAAAGTGAGDGVAAAGTGADAGVATGTSAGANDAGTGVAADIAATAPAAPSTTSSCQKQESPQFGKF